MKNMFTIYEKTVGGRTYTRYYKNWDRAEKDREADKQEFETALGVKFTHNERDQVYLGESAGEEISLQIYSAVFADAVEF